MDSRVKMNLKEFLEKCNNYDVGFDGEWAQDICYVSSFSEPTWDKILTKEGKELFKRALQCEILVNHAEKNALVQATRQDERDVQTCAKFFYFLAGECSEIACKLLFKEDEASSLDDKPAVSVETAEFLKFFNFVELVQFSGIIQNYKKPEAEPQEAWYIRFFNADDRAVTFFLGFNDSDRIPEFEPGVHYNKDLNPLR